MDDTTFIFLFVAEFGVDTIWFIREPNLTKHRTEIA